jgi:hypothetical protein
MKTNYVLIDFENVQVKSLALLKDDHFRVYVFLGPHNAKLPVDLVIAMQGMGSRAAYVTLEKPGNNALDFHIAYYLGVLSQADPAGAFHVISKDSGFDPLIQHLKKIRIQASRCPSIEAIAGLTAVSAPAPHTITAGPPAPPGRQAPRTAPDHAEPAPVSDTDALVKIAQNHLTKQRTSRPRTLKTLLSTLHATCGKELSEHQIQAVCQSLVRRGYVKFDGTRVAYSLPAS